MCYMTKLHSCCFLWYHVPVFSVSFVRSLFYACLLTSPHISVRTAAAVVMTDVTCVFYVSCQTLLRRVVYLQMMPSELVRMKCQQLTGAAEQSYDESKHRHIGNQEQDKVLNYLSFKK